MNARIQKVVCSKNCLHSIFVLLVFISTVLFFQNREGSFENEFGAHPDEAAHYVTGLMVYDYLVSFPSNPQDPLTYAKNYYLHFPKVAFGHWPPMFYLSQAIWFLLFGTSRLSILMFIGLNTALVALLLYLTVSHLLDKRFGLLSGITFIALPLVRQYSGMAMAELPLSLFSFLALIFFYQYMKTERYGYGLLFSLFACAAILTKGNALGLALLPPLAVLFSGRIHLLKKPSFWMPALIVGIVCGPFYYFTFSLAQGTWQEASPGFSYAVKALIAYSSYMVNTLGYGLALFATIGLILVFFLPLFRLRTDLIGAALGSYIIGILTFHIIVPSSIEARNMIMVLPVLIIFAVLGIFRVISYLPPDLKRKYGGHILLIIGILVLYEPLTKTYSKSYNGFESVSNEILMNTDKGKQTVLIVSDSSGEGMFIAEMARENKNFEHLILRGTKVLAESDWIGTNYRSFYKNPDQVMQYLRGVPVRYLVFDTSVHSQRDKIHYDLLDEMLRKYKTAWEKIGSYPLTRSGVEYQNAIDLYSLDRQEFSHQIQDRGVNVDTDQLFKKYFDFLAKVKKLISYFSKLIE